MEGHDRFFDNRIGSQRRVSRRVRVSIRRNGSRKVATSPSHVNAGSGERYISATDIQNCQSADGTQDGLCRLQMLGAVTAPTPPANHTMYLNFVALAFDTSNEGPSTNGVTPKLHLSSGQFDAACDPSVFPDAGALCRFSP